MNIVSKCRVCGQARTLPRTAGPGSGPGSGPPAAEADTTLAENTTSVGALMHVVAQPLPDSATPRALQPARHLQRNPVFSSRSPGGSKAEF